MIVELTKAQLAHALSLAIARHDAKHTSFRNKDTTEFANDAKTDLAENMDVCPQYMAHFIGVLGEMAWSVHSGEPLDEEIYAVRDGGEDFAGLEVKTLTYFGVGEPELKIPETEFYKRASVKTYVLARVNPKTPKRVELLGKISRKKFEEEKKSKKYGRYKPRNFVVGQSRMDPI